MSPNQIVRAWKDADYRADLAQTDAMPASPVGDIELADSLLELAGGDARTEYLESMGCCQGFTQLGKCDFTSSGGGFLCSVFCFTIAWSATEMCPAI